MSGVAELLKSFGHTVTGSDLKSGGHRAENITRDIDVVVRTSAVNEGSPGWVEVLRARELQIPVMKRSEILGEITDKYKLIAVAGAHGKTTVTALLGLCLIEGGFDPTVLVGEKIHEFQDGVLKIGKSKYFVMESCEYDRSFLDFHPEAAIITNIDLEHLDTYPGGLEEIKEAFLGFINNIKVGGVLVYCCDDKNLDEVVSKSNRNDIKIIEFSKKDFVNYQEELKSLKIWGKHNQINAVSVIKMCEAMSMNDTEVIKRVFSTFSGAKRRMEYYGEFGNNMVFDDYGHHPSEIRATLLALTEKYPNLPIRVVFWPHQYKRILPLIEQFGGAFREADEVLVKPIYFVPGRDAILQIDSSDLARKIEEISKIRAKVMENDDEIVKYLEEKKNEEGIILTIGIPPVYEVAKNLTKRSEDG